MPGKPLKPRKTIYCHNVSVYHFKELKVKMKTFECGIRKEGAELIFHPVTRHSAIRIRHLPGSELLEKFLGLQLFPQVVLQKEGENGLALFQGLGRE